VRAKNGQTGNPAPLIAPHAPRFPHFPGKHGKNAMILPLVHRRRPVLHTFCGQDCAQDQGLPDKCMIPKGIFIMRKKTALKTRRHACGGRFLFNPVLHTFCG
jgi:hypothetical protein